MDINADYNARAVVHAARIPWNPSPMPGVERRPLDRLGDVEAARATTIVRFAPGSAFSPHVHTGGEEYLVLEGEFQDETGDFAAGYYVRNPPDSSHTPRADKGATILVKLRQFDPDDHEPLAIQTHDLEPTRQSQAVSTIPLFESDYENVRIEVWQPNAEIRVDRHQGLEILVLEGGFREAQDDFSRWSWLRLPPDAPLHAVAGDQGARVWIKSDHLGRPILPPTE